MLTKDQKKEIVKEIEQKAQKSKALVFADYTGLNVKEISALRQEMRQSGIEFKVARKTLIDLGLRQAKIGGVAAKDLTGQLGVAFSATDEVAPAKILDKFARQTEKIKILGGVLEKKFIDAAQAMALAKLPDKQELIAKVVGSIRSPLAGLGNVLRGNLRGLVCALGAIAEKKS